MYISLQVQKWEDLRHLVSILPGNWIFRGQTREDWDLTSSLERALSNLVTVKKRELIEDKEKVILKEFKRRAHHYIISTPALNDDLEWLAIIQHYGGSTRLLDFSHSFYVATYFAVNKSTEDLKNHAIWAVNADIANDSIKRKLDKKLSDEIERDINAEYVSLAQKLLENGVDEDLVFTVEPERMNERLAIQQGLFLFPCNMGSSYLSNLAGIFDETETIFDSTVTFNYEPSKSDDYIQSIITDLSVLKIIIPTYLREEILRDLWSMNVSDATLFPGIDGFTRSLNYHLLS